MRRERSRAVRPVPEVLETRQLLAAFLRGVDVDGDRWSLRLVGPGDLTVVNQDDSQGNAVPLSQPGLINSITIAGTDPQTSRVIGHVRKSSTGDGKIFFASIDQLGGVSPRFPGAPLGTLAVDIPHFWLGQTSTSTTAPEPSITMNFGVATLRFGGADVTFTPPGGTPLNQNAKSDSFVIALGLPFTWGTSIVAEGFISDAQAGVGTAPATQDSITIAVAGRLNVFQANYVKGNAQLPSTGFQGGGGTLVVSAQDSSRTITGQIGFVRVGGAVTNFAVQTNDRISNIYIGGETSNFSVLAPQGTRTVQFGLGMDDVTIRSRFIDSLQANRGAVGSDVTTTDHIGRITIGGDVVNTNVLAGYEENLANVFSTQTPPSDSPAKSTASINNILIAGDVVDSIFAASVQPADGQFDVPQALKFPHSHISAKVEGTISNENATPNKPGQAFYAKQVAVAHGPVNPPNVPNPPFPNPFAPPSGNRIVTGLQPTVPARRIRKGG